MDKRNSGFTGRGPRPSQRSDIRIQEDVNEELLHSPLVDASDVEVEVASGEVALNGTVSTREEKREAEECAWRVRGVQDVHNRLRIDRRLREGVDDIARGLPEPQEHIP